MPQLVAKNNMSIEFEHLQPGNATPRELFSHGSPLNNLVNYQSSDYQKIIEELSRRVIENVLKGKPATIKIEATDDEKLEVETQEFEIKNGQIILKDKSTEELKKSDI